MSTIKARKALDGNLKNYVNARMDPVLYNLCQALKELSQALDEIESKVDYVSRQVALIGARQHQ